MRTEPAADSIGSRRGIFGSARITRNGVIIPTPPYLLGGTQFIDIRACAVTKNAEKKGPPDTSVGRFHGFDWSFLGRGRCRGQVSDLPFACPEGAPRLAGQGWPKAIAARRVSALDA